MNFERFLQDHLHMILDINGSELEADFEDEGGGDFEQWLVEHLRYLYVDELQRLRKKYKPNGVVYRGVKVSEAWINNALYGEGPLVLGRYWSESHVMAVSFSAGSSNYDERFIKADGISVVMTGRIEFGAIDVNETIRAQMIGGESEITLRPGVPVFLNSLRVNKTDYKIERMGRS